jgi:hypothetical protein
MRMLEITSAEYVDGYRVRLRFNNGREGVVNLVSFLWGPMFEPLRDLAAFRQFSVSEVVHTLCWQNDADLAPESLYEKMVEQAEAGTSPKNTALSETV